MAVARPKRLTTVVADPGLLQLTPPLTLPGSEPAPEPEGEAASGEVLDPEPAKARVVVREVSPKDDTGQEDLSSVRLRPRRVIVIK